MLAEVSLGLFVVWFSHFVLTTYLRRRNMPSGPLPYPFIGNLPHLLCDPIIPFAKLAEKYGDIYSLSFANIEAIVVSTHSLIHEAKIERRNDFTGRHTSSMYPVIELIENDIVSADFSPSHSFRRKVLQAGFHLFGSGIDQASERARNAVDLAIEYINSQQGRPFSPNILFNSAIMVELWQWLTSKKQKLNDPVIKDLSEFSQISFHQGCLVPLYQILPFLKFLPARFNPKLERGKMLRKQLFFSELEQHKKSYKPCVVRDLTDGFISAYAKEISKEVGKDIGSEKDIIGLMLDVVIAGSDTTATSLSWFLFYMVLNPHIQEKIHEELDLVVGRSRFPTWNDVEKMPYMQAALCELERACSVFPVTWTHAIRDTTLSGYHIRKGTFLILNLYKLHHDEKVWPEPEKFKPERFLDSDKKFVGWDKVDGFLPFGLGRRQCPGKSLAKIVLFTFASSLLHRYKFKLPEGANIFSSEPADVSSVLHPPNYEIVAMERFCDSN